MKYYGLFCSQCGVWFRKGFPEPGNIVFYPAPEIAQADFDEMHRKCEHRPDHHLFSVTEFGRENYAKPDDQPESTELCPVICARLNQERYRSDLLKI